MPAADFCAAGHKLLETRLQGCSAKEKTEIPPDPKAFDEWCKGLAAVAAVDATVAPKCLEAVEKHGARWESLFRDLPACQRVFVGAAGPGAKCSDNAECAGDGLCLHGQCVAPQPPGAECEVAFDGRTGCVDGYACHNEKEEKDTCEKLVKVGDACGDKAVCPFGAVCRGTCTLPSDEGAACEQSSDCKQDLRCLKKRDTDPKGTCAPLLRAGESCTDATDCITMTCGADRKCAKQCGFGG